MTVGTNQCPHGSLARVCELCEAQREIERLWGALAFAEAALADIGDADREPDDDLAWCEARAAQALPRVRAALGSECGPDAAEDERDELRGEIARLHGAVCQAVALLNRAPEVARCDEARQAHTILREVLVLHADEYMAAPATEREREAVARKHLGA